MKYNVGWTTHSQQIEIKLMICHYWDKRLVHKNSLKVERMRVEKTNFLKNVANINKVEEVPVWVTQFVTHLITLPNRR